MVKKKTSRKKPVARKKNSPPTMSTGDLVRYLGITRQAIAKWKEQGCPSESRGHWNLAAVLQWRIDRERKQHKQHLGMIDIDGENISGEEMRRQALNSLMGAMKSEEGIAQVNAAKAVAQFSHDIDSPDHRIDVVFADIDIDESSRIFATGRLTAICPECGEGVSIGQDKDTADE